MNLSTKLPKAFVFIIPQVIETRNTLERVPVGSSSITVGSPRGGPETCRVGEISPMPIPQWRSILFPRHSSSRRGMIWLPQQFWLELCWYHWYFLWVFIFGVDLVSWLRSWLVSSFIPRYYWWDLFSCFFSVLDRSRVSDGFSYVWRRTSTRNWVIAARWFTIVANNSHISCGVISTLHQSNHQYSLNHIYLRAISISSLFCSLSHSATLVLSSFEIRLASPTPCPVARLPVIQFVLHHRKKKLCYI